jgi:hypothetical protein
LDRGGDGDGQLRTLNNEWINPAWSCHAKTLPLFGSSWKRIRINRANIDLLLAQCQTIAVDDVADERPYSGAKLKLYILRYNGP